jgi:hypothetical protein
VLTLALQPVRTNSNDNSQGNEGGGGAVTGGAGGGASVGCQQSGCGNHEQ